MSQRFGIRFAEDSLVPCVEITARELSRVRVLDRYVTVHSDVVVARRFGFTRAHAMNRALEWSRKHGDPR